MAKDFITNSILQSTADAIRYCDKTTNSIAPKDYADRIRELDKLIPQPDALNFYMPNGGTISLNKTGSPTVVELEYSLDKCKTWTVWQPDNYGNRSLVLSAGQRMYVRNASETATMFSTSDSNWYLFSFTDNTYAGGSVNSLLCKNPEDAVLSEYCFYRLFRSAGKLLSAPILPSMQTRRNCYRGMFISSGIITPPVMEAINATDGCCQSMFENCTSLTESPVIKFTSITDSMGALKWMFYRCSSLNKITIYAAALTAPNCTQSWVSGVAATGDFYCDPNLTISAGVYGIPSGWTRHDI